MIRAAIDIGSNTTLFLVAESQGAGRWSLVEEDLIPNGLGWQLTPDGRLTDEVQRRNLDILRSLVDRCRSYRVDSIRCAGTAALRKARNSKAFLRIVLEETGLEIRVIFGEEEARLTYLGAILDFGGIEQPLRVVDVGGGSSELVLGHGNKVLEAVSLPIGAVSLTQEAIPSQPLSKQQHAEIQRVIMSRLDSVSEDIVAASGPVITVGGTAATLAAMTLGIDITELWRHQPVRTEDSMIEAYCIKFAGLSVADIARLSHMPADRAGIITAGTVILLTILKILHAEHVMLSNKGLRWGLLIDEDTQQASRDLLAKSRWRNS